MNGVVAGVVVHGVVVGAHGVVVGAHGVVVGAHGVVVGAHVVVITFGTHGMIVFMLHGR